MNRNDQLERLRIEKQWDVAVVGGGATGLGVALDAAARGFRVVLIEASDFAKGTSSRSTKLVHGGVRYLAQGNVALVREALHERSTLLANAPHLAQPLAFVMPGYTWWERGFYGVGLKAYDALAGSRGLGSTQLLSTAQVKALIPTVRTRGLSGGVKYWDGQFDDARLALAIARTAAARGAVLANYCAATGLMHDNGRVVARKRRRHDNAAALQKAGPARRDQHSTRVAVRVGATRLRRRLSNSFQRESGDKGFASRPSPWVGTRARSQPASCQSPRIQRWRRAMSSL